MSLLVGVLNNAGEFDQSEAYITESIDILRGVLSDDHLQIAFSKSQLGECLVGQGRYEEAEELLIPAHIAIVRAQGKDNFYTVDSLSRIVKLYDAWGRPARATPYRTEFAEISLRSKHIMPWPMTRLAFGPEEQELVASVDRLLELIGSAPTPSSVGFERVMADIVSLRHALLTDEDPLSAVLGRLLTLWVLEWEGTVPDVVRQTLTAEAVAMLTPWSTSVPVDLSAALIQQSFFCLRGGDPQRAEELARESWTLMRRAEGARFWYTAFVRARLGRCLVEQGRYAEAEPLLLQSYGVLRSQLGESDRYAAKTRSYLVDLYRFWGKPVSEIENKLQERR